MTVMLVVPVLPCASRTVAVSVWVPLITDRVSHGKVTGPRVDVVCVPDLLAIGTQREDVGRPARALHPHHDPGVPPTVSLFRGCVMKTLSVLGGGGTCRRPTASVVSFPRRFLPST